MPASNGEEVTPGSLSQLVFGSSSSSIRDWKRHISDGLLLLVLLVPPLAAVAGVISWSLAHPCLVMQQQQQEAAISGASSPWPHQKWQRDAASAMAGLLVSNASMMGQGHQQRQQRRPEVQTQTAHLGCMCPALLYLVWQGHLKHQLLQQQPQQQWKTLFLWLLVLLMVVMRVTDQEA